MAKTERHSAGSFQHVPLYSPEVTPKQEQTASNPALFEHQKVSLSRNPPIPPKTNPRRAPSAPTLNTTPLNHSTETLYKLNSQGELIPVVNHANPTLPKDSEEDVDWDGWPDGAMDRDYSHAQFSATDELITHWAHRSDGGDRYGKLE
ncbi:hypothetical protein H0H93_016316 [Arthromyces matolae]|nr:hypothetical protein H0H93_016316 [Arthromyces matolae]